MDRPALPLSQIVRHGGCLGLGLAGMASANLGWSAVLSPALSQTSTPPPSLPPPLPSLSLHPDAYNLLKENLMTSDDAVIGEAAGLAMGLVMIGTASPMAIEDMTSVCGIDLWSGPCNG